jgi:drug/metabolite transporter (DMT)-like permease
LYYLLDMFVLEQLTSKNGNHTHRALALMTVSATFFGVMAFSAKVASARLSGPEIAFVRFAIGLTPLIFVPRYRRAALHFQRLDLLFYRGFFGGVAVLLYFLTIEHMSAGEATLLNYTAPIFSGLLSVFVLGEVISPKVLIPLPIAFTGIALVVHAQPAAKGWLIAGIASAVCSGTAVTAMRAARRTEGSWSVYGAFCLLGLFTTLPQTILGWKTPHGIEWLALAATGLCAMGGQLLLTFSLRWIDAMTSGVIAQLAVLVSMACGAVFLHDRITPSVALGAALTIGGVCGVVYFSSFSKPVRPADEVAPEL